LIACERIGRRAALMEIDPRYCDVIIKRWEELSGKKAILDGSGRTFKAVAEERHQLLSQEPACEIATP